MNTTFDEHPTVKTVRERLASRTASQSLEAGWLREVCLEAGADDAGFVSLQRPELDDQREDILRTFPPARTAISIVCRMNRENIRNPARSTANVEFHPAGGHTNEWAGRTVRTLEGRAVRA